MKVASAVSVVMLAASLAVGSSCTSDKTGPAPTLMEAGEAEYSGIYDSPVRLIEGFYEGEPFAEGSESRPTVRLFPDIIAKGDIDGDGGDEAVVLLLEDSGGSGSFLYVAVLARRGVEIENRGTRLVGDRVQVRDMEIEGGELFMEVVQHGPEDAMCCPTQKARRKWTLAGDALLEGPSAISGKLSLDDLEGVKWALRQIDDSEPYTGDPSVSLIFENGKISGFSGCNRYFGKIIESSSGSIEIFEIGTTRMACPDEVMKIECRYLAALGGATGYGFSAGRLVLICDTEDESTTLVFMAVIDGVTGE